MKIRLLLVAVLTLALGACSTATSYRGSKRVTQGIDYKHHGANEAHYEFTSVFPSQDVRPNDSFSGEGAEVELGEDEDFTSDSLTGSYGRYGDVVVTVASRKFQLGDNPSGKMPLFMKAVETAYAKALRTYRPSGFIYTMSSVGAINPLSDVQIHCRMSEHSANDNGQTACNFFFQHIRTEFIRLQEVKS